MVPRMTQAHPDIIPFPGRPTTVAPVAVTPEAPPPVLIVSADSSLTDSLATDLRSAGFEVQTADSVDTALQSMLTSTPEVCLVGPLASGETAGQLAGTIQQRGWATQLICTTSDSTNDVPSILSSTIGIELLAVPYAANFLTLMVTAACQRSRSQNEIKRLRRQLCNRNLRDMVGQSPAMQQLRQSVQQMADHNTAVLLVGETGSGLDLVAQGIHDASRRAHRPFVTIDCSVHSAETLEQELFGIAASGGSPRQPGRFEQADGGTLLLDNVNCIALPLQRKLAMVLREQRFEHDRTGDRVRIDVRVVLGTSVDLDELIARGLFRSELCQDAACNRIDVPSLRSRPEDIAALSEFALRKLAAREGLAPRSLTMDALHLLQSYQWPGNLRELESVIERACTIDSSRRLTAALLEPWMTVTASDDVPCGLTLQEMERRLIETTFARFAGNREKTAKALQIGIRTLSGKLRDYGYPPRGGPGSNAKPWVPVAAPYDEVAAEQRAA